MSQNMQTCFLSGVRTAIVKDDWKLAYSLDWRYGSVLGKNSLRFHAMQPSMNESRESSDADNPPPG